MLCQDSNNTLSGNSTSAATVKTGRYQRRWAGWAKEKFSGNDGVEVAANTVGAGCVGAGWPAMQAPRCVSHTEVMLSQASQLPHKAAPTFRSVFSSSPRDPSGEWPQPDVYRLLPPARYRPRTCPRLRLPPMAAQRGWPETPGSHRQRSSAPQAWSY